MTPLSCDIIVIVRYREVDTEIGSITYLEYEYDDTTSKWRIEAEAYITLSEDSEFGPYRKLIHRPRDSRLSIIITAANEYGGATCKVFENVKVKSIKGSVGVDATNLKETITFECTNVSGWVPVEFKRPE